jgi:hypothetical protein
MRYAKKRQRLLPLQLQRLFLSGLEAPAFAGPQNRLKAELRTFSISLVRGQSAWMTLCTLLQQSQRYHEKEVKGIVRCEAGDPEIEGETPTRDRSIVQQPRQRLAFLHRSCEETAHK